MVDRMDGDLDRYESQRKGENQDAGPPPAPRAEEDGAEHGQKEESVRAYGSEPDLADRGNRPGTVRAHRRFSGKISSRRPLKGTRRARASGSGRGPGERRKTDHARGRLRRRPPRARSRFFIVDDSYYLSQAARPQTRAAACVENPPRALPRTRGRIEGHFARSSGPALRPGVQRPVKTRGSGHASGATPRRGSAPDERVRATSRSLCKGVRGTRRPSSSPERLLRAGASILRTDKVAESSPRRRPQPPVTALTMVRTL